MGATCSTCDCSEIGSGSSRAAVTAGDLLAEEEEMDDRVGEMYEHTAVLGKRVSGKRLPCLLGAESMPSPSTESTAESSSRERPHDINTRLAEKLALLVEVDDRIFPDGDRYSTGSMTHRHLSDPGSMTHRHLSDPGLSTGRNSESDLPVSSYPVCEALNRYKSRHVIWAPSPTHSVHRSEKSVAPYAEVYGIHPATFDFNKRGQKIDSHGHAIGVDGMISPTGSPRDSDDDSPPPYDGRFGRHPDFTKKMGPSAAKVVQAPRAPPGAILYN